jgi:hypothetical protein
MLLGWYTTLPVLEQHALVRGIQIGRDRTHWQRVPSRFLDKDPRRPLRGSRIHCHRASVLIDDCYKWVAYLQYSDKSSNDSGTRNIRSWSWGGEGVRTCVDVHICQILPTVHRYHPSIISLSTAVINPVSVGAGRTRGDGTNLTSTTSLSFPTLADSRCSLPRSNLAPGNKNDVTMTWDHFERQTSRSKGESGENVPFLHLHPTIPSHSRLLSLLQYAASLYIHDRR